MARAIKERTPHDPQTMTREEVQCRLHRIAAELGDGGLDEIRGTELRKERERLIAKFASMCNPPRVQA